MKKILILFGIAVLAAGVFATQRMASAGTLTVTKTVYLEHRAVADPQVIVRTHDNGFIIAGSIDEHGQSKRAWAVRINDAGAVLWRYPQTPPGNIRVENGPWYSSAVVMPDDSVFLCGGTSLNEGTKANSPGLMTHIDKDGKLLNEKLFYPQDGRSVAISSLNTCLKSGSGVIAVGNTTQFTGDVKVFYLIEYLDATGNGMGEQVVPAAKEMQGVLDHMSLRAVKDGGLVFSAVSNGTASEVVHIKQGGSIGERKTFDAPFIIVSPLKEGAAVELVSTGAKSLRQVTLDDRLQETGHTAAAAPGTGAVDMAYRLPDQSLLAFGTGHPESNVSDARVMRFDAALKEENTLALGPRGESRRVLAAVPSDRPDEFVTARGALNTEEMGLALDFVQLKR